MKIKQKILEEGFWICSECGKKGEVSEISEDGKSCDFQPTCKCPLERIRALYAEKDVYKAVEKLVREDIRRDVEKVLRKELNEFADMMEIKTTFQKFEDKDGNISEDRDTYPQIRNYTNMMTRKIIPEEVLKILKEKEDDGKG